MPLFDVSNNKNQPAIFNRRSFPWRKEEEAIKGPKELPPIPISSSNGSTTWRVDGQISFHANMVSESYPRKPVD